MNGDQVNLRLNKRSFLFISLLLVVITIPLENLWNSRAILCFVFAALIQAPSKAHFRQLKQHRYWILAVVYFFWHLITWFWDSPDAAFNIAVESHAAFLSLPIILTIIPRFSWRELTIACYAFIATIFVLCVIALIKAYLEYQVTHNPFVFSYHYLGYQVDLNAVFLSNYCFAGIVWLLYFNFLAKAQRAFIVPVWLVIFLCLFFFGMILLLSSKLVILIAGITLVIFAVAIAGRRKRIAGIAIAVFTILSAVLIIRNVEYLRFRFTSLQLKEYSGQQDNQNALAARLLMWQSAVELIKEKPLLGYGIVRSKEALMEKYQQKGFEIGVRLKYNSHNQYLESWLNAGIVGLILFLALLYFPLRTAVRDKKLLLLILLLHYMLQSLVEATLTVQQELIFFWFFIWLFYLHLPLGRKPVAATASAMPQPAV